MYIQQPAPGVTVQPCLSPQPLRSRAVTKARSRAPGQYGSVTAAAETCLNNTLPQKEENKCKSEPLIPVQDFVTINRKRQEVDQT